MSIQIFEYYPDNNFYEKSPGSSFPMNLYISNVYGKAPVSFSADDIFTEEILDFLKDNAKLVSFTCNGKIEKFTDYFKDIRGGSYIFFYKDVFVSVIRKHQDDSDEHFYDDSVVRRYDDPTDQKNTEKNKKLFNLSFKGPVGCEFPINDFKSYVYRTRGPQINIFVKNQFGEYVFESLAVKIPENLELESNYGKSFVPVSDSIINKLETCSSGLFMFHGPSGTGKSTYIKYLATKVNRDFIYIPNTMLETFTTDPSCLQMLIQKSNSVLVLEDAEKLIMKRHGDSLDTSAVSSILNMTDGIMGDILNISLIITYNCDAKDIDPALKRKGRLKMNYKFDLLSKEDAKNLAKKLKYPKDIIDEQIKDSMSIADIYNLKETVSFGEEITENKRIGF
jgi:hypothetical protein